MREGVRRLGFTLLLVAGGCASDPHPFNFDDASTAPATGRLDVNLTGLPGPIDSSNPKQGVVLADDQSFRLLGARGYEDDYFWIDFRFTVDTSAPAPWAFDEPVADAFLFVSRERADDQRESTEFMWEDGFSQEIGHQTEEWVFAKTGAVEQYAPLDGHAKGHHQVVRSCTGDTCPTWASATARVDFDLRWDPRRLAP